MAPGAKPIMAATVDTIKRTRKKVLGEKEVKNHLMMAPNSRGRNRFHGRSQKVANNKEIDPFIRNTLTLAHFAVTVD